MATRKKVISSIKKKTKKNDVKKSASKNNMSEPLSGGSTSETKVTVFGIGGGGSSIISEIAGDLKKITFIAANTDRGALSKVPSKVKRFQFGEKITKGFGTGMDFDLGKEAAATDKERIKKIMQGQDVCIFVVSLGGGAGSGGVLSFAKAAKEAGCIAYGIFTLPFSFEGVKKMEIAKKSIEEVKPYLNAITILPNENIFKVTNKETPLKDALSAVNKNLSENLKCLMETIYGPGLINIDFADLRTIMEGRGRLAYLNVATIGPAKEGENVFTELISSPFYSYGIKGSGGILLNIVGNKDLGLNFISEISKTISGLSRKNAKLVLGISQSGGTKGVTKVVLLAIGCDSDFPETKPKKKETTKEYRPKPKKKAKETTVTREKSLKKKNFLKEDRPEKEEVVIPQEEKTDIKVRRNAMEIKKAIEEAEKEILDQEKKWETPAFLRRKI